MIKNLTIIIISLILNSFITIFFLYEKPQKIVVIDNEEIFQEMVAKITRDTDGADERAIEQEVAKYDDVLKKFQQELAFIAEKNNLVVLHKYNVLGGAIDQTHQAIQVMLNLMEKENNVTR